MAVNNPLTGTQCGLPWSLCAGCHGGGFPHGKEHWWLLFVRNCAYPVPQCCGHVITHCYCLKYKNHKMPETSLCSFFCQRQLCRTAWTSKKVSQVSLILLHCGRCRSIQLTTGSTATLSQGHSQGQVILQWILSCFLADTLCTQLTSRERNCFLCVLLSPF